MAIYETIAAEIEQRIASGIYKPGEKIPAIRRMAEEFGCNKLTVQKAFERLKRDGFLENVVGSGSFVRFPEKISRTGDIFDFKTAYISESFFPCQEAKAIFSDLFDTEKTGVFSPPPVEGDPAFLKILGEYYQVPTRRMIIISGAQQGLDLIAKVFAARISDAILFEDPTYPGAISLFRARHFVPLEADGPDLKRLDKKLSRKIRLFYTMPAVHNPTGISYSIAKKKAIARRAGEHPFYIIEDDYLSEFQEAPVPRFVDIFPEKTIYIKSLSQTTVSGIRLGFMIVPDALYDKFLYTKYTSDLVSTGVLQKFARAFIRSGAYRAYVDEMRRKTLTRKARLLELISGYPALSVRPGQSGYSLWVRSEKDADLPRVPWSRGRDFSFSPEFANCFRLSFMHMDDVAFEQATACLRTFLDRIA
ncbi:PLP-dependent aminotransferase family protein [Desulfonema ishimotonii]|uniref:PLP-dependent aminotransferase family protein n=1 Tax=Desulfonema ishimotonii TaxID=45657 RepID=A0A401FXM6_9BACT|nr:PLP-dependent aminotransferase family protein [Desulfonema ishimotonii]GBC61762.1 PLP-dependent aminotransferase family protein [Desulfonema ishimotonii]